MFSLTSFVTAWCMLLALAMTATPLSAVPKTGVEYITFSGPVELPGVRLGPGTYIFEVVDLMSSSDLVRVRNKVTYKVCFLGFTRRVDRPAGLRQNQSIVLGEVPSGLAPPILAWYPFGERWGHEFVHNETAS
jgi:hypothetical protein